MTAATNIKGMKFGRLTVLRRSKRKLDKFQKALWDCRCKCGTISMVRGSSLLNGVTKSCGCLRAEISATKKATQKYGRPSLDRAAEAIRQSADPGLADPGWRVAQRLAERRQDR